MATYALCPSPACRTRCPIAETGNGRSITCSKCGKTFVAKSTQVSHKDETNKGYSSKSNPFPNLPAEFGRYRILEVLGRGGMGVVYLAEDTLLGRQVALKIPFFDSSDSSQRVERFAREARAAAVLHHPNICTVFDAGEIDGKPFITMACISGTPLEQEIDPEVPMPPHRVAGIVRKIADAIQYAHSQGIIHRDLKPANIMLTANDEPVVMDFGLAKSFGDFDPNEARLTREGGILGTPSYMSPEQVKGDDTLIGPASDIYSLGVVLFEMLTGGVPFGGSAGVVMGQILVSPLPPLSEFRPDIDPQLDAICRTAMAKNPSDRFASMAGFATALATYLKFPTLVATESTSEKVQNIPDRPLRKKRPVIAVALACLLLGLLTVWAVGAFKVKLKEGTVILDDLPADAEVVVDGETVTVARNGEQATVKLNSAGPHKLKVVQGNKEVFSSDLTVDIGGKPVRVRVEAPVAVKAVAAIPTPMSVEIAPKPVEVPKKDLTAKQIFREHKAGVRSVLFSPDGLRLVSGSYGNYVEKGGLKQAGPDNSVRVWNLESGKQIRHFDFTAPRISGVQGLCISPDGRYVGACTSWATMFSWMCPYVYVWEIDTSKRTRFFPLTEQVILHAIQFADNGATLRVAHGGKQIVSWSEGEKLVKFDYSSKVTPETFSNDGEKLYGGDEAGGIWVIDAKTGTKLAILSGHVKPIVALAASADGKRLLSSSKDFSVRLWEIESGKPVVLLKGLDGIVSCVALNRDGSRFVTGDNYGNVRLWDATTNQELACFTGHTGRVQTVAISPNGKLAASGGTDTTVRVWRLPFE